MHLLVFRFSAMGDVALITPVLRGLLNDNPEMRITLVTRSFFSPFFSGIDRLEVFLPDFNSKHKGLSGVFKIYKELKQKNSYDYIIDLHDVIRTKILKILFRSSGNKISTIKKERHIKNSYLKKEVEPKLMHSIERYHLVFKNAGLKFSNMIPPVFSLSQTSKDKATAFIEGNNITGKKLIGIAPFAKHKLKVWPINKVRNLIDKLTSLPKVHILLFGGGNLEKEQLNLLAARYLNKCTVVSLEFSNEIALMHKMSLMISMDSANMHIASLSGIPVVSIWGATHPGIGFGAWHQPEAYSIQKQVNDLPCRPCSIYGKGGCRRGDFACMNWINAEDVLNVAKNII